MQANGNVPLVSLLRASNALDRLDAAITQMQKILVLNGKNILVSIRSKNNKYNIQDRVSIVSPHL